MRVISLFLLKRTVFLTEPREFALKWCGLRRNMIVRDKGLFLYLNGGNVPMG